MKRFYLPESHDNDAPLDAGYRLHDLLRGELDLAECGSEFDPDLSFEEEELAF